jgi:mono/diheme cytochrome c family protein
MGAEPGAGAAVFASRCAVCHGQQAAGIPGTFPSLHEQIVGFAKTPPGRDYLIMVVSTGLMGELKINGTRYNNVMPAQSGLSEAEVAGVLNYLAGDLGKNDLGAAAISAEDVKATRDRHPDKTPQATRALRPATEP